MSTEVEGVPSPEVVTPDPVQISGVSPDGEPDPAGDLDTFDDPLSRVVAPSSLRSIIVGRDRAHVPSGAAVLDPNPTSQQLEMVDLRDPVYFNCPERQCPVPLWLPVQSLTDFQMRSLSTPPMLICTDVDGTIACNTELLHDLGHKAAFRYFAGREMADWEWEDRFSPVSKFKADSTACANIVEKAKSLGIYGFADASGEMFQHVKTVSMMCYLGMDVETANDIVMATGERQKACGQALDIGACRVLREFDVEPVPGIADVFELVRKKSGGTAAVVGVTGGAYHIARMTMQKTMEGSGSVSDFIHTFVASDGPGHCSPGKPHPTPYLEGWKLGMDIVGEESLSVQDHEHHFPVWAFEDRPTGAISAARAFHSSGLVFVANWLDPKADAVDLARLALSGDACSFGRLSPIVTVDRDGYGGLVRKLTPLWGV